MKKIIIAMAMIVILGTVNSAMAFVSGLNDFNSRNRATFQLLNSMKPTLFPWWRKQSSKLEMPTTPQHYLEIVELLKQQLEQARETHKSITENRQFGVEKTDYTSFFLKNPELVYNEDNASDISASVKNILQKEKVYTSLQESRDTINKRIQYAIVADKAVSLKTFQDAENRFKQILGLVEQINKTTDLKSIADLQAHIAGMVALIQNETTKLQMVNYSHNAEQAFIKQKKYKRNMEILNSKNTKMPKIKSIR